MDLLQYIMDSLRYVMELAGLFCPMFTWLLVVLLHPLLCPLVALLLRDFIVDRICWHHCCKVEERVPGVCSSFLDGGRGVWMGLKQARFKWVDWSSAPPGKEPPGKQLPGKEQYYNWTRRELQITYCNEQPNWNVNIPMRCQWEQQYCSSASITTTRSSSIRESCWATHHESKQQSRALQSGWMPGSSSREPAEILPHPRASLHVQSAHAVDQELVYIGNFHRGC